MEKIIKKSVQQTQISHEFYCDDCGEYICGIIEDSDGYYPQYGKFRLSLNLTPDNIIYPQVHENDFNHDKEITDLKGWYNIDRTLCEDCAKKEMKKLVDGLIALGFTRDKTSYSS